MQVQPPNVILPQAKAYKGDVMSIKDTLTAELATAQQALADAETKYHATVAQVQADWDAAKSKAAALEQQLANIPAEVEQMADDVFTRLKAWFNAVV
jgi:predicted  nucleic acid-binding Zn-ribbon protein